MLRHRNSARPELSLFYGFQVFACMVLCALMQVNPHNATFGLVRGIAATRSPLRPISQGEEHAGFEAPAIVIGTGDHVATPGPPVARNACVRHAVRLELR